MFTPELVQQIGVPLIAVIVPLLIALFKKIVPSLPTFAIPIIALGMGPLFDAGISWVTGLQGTGMTAVLYGLAGVGLRELKDQLQKAINPPAT